MLNKLLSKISRFFLNLISKNYTLNHKFLNRHQITNLTIAMNSLKNRGYKPTNIYDIGCFEGKWTIQMLKIFNNAHYFLFDANKENETVLNNLKQKIQNINFKIRLLSDDIKEYTFFKMKSGSSIFEEQTDHPRETVKVTSTMLSNELHKDLIKSKDNLIKIDAQGSEIKILNGLKDFIKNFEVVILEVSLHQYNKGAPLFDEVLRFMDEKNFQFYDIYDLKRLGENKSFLIQFDTIFIRKNSSLLDVKF